MLSMAREYVGQCERMARQVWRSARKGDLPPWSSLAGDEFVVREHAPQSSTEENDDKQEIVDTEDARPPAYSQNDTAVTVKTSTVRAAVGPRTMPSGKRCSRNSAPVIMLQAQSFDRPVSLCACLYVPVVVQASMSYLLMSHSIDRSRPDLCLG